MPNTAELDKYQPLVSALSILSCHDIPTNDLERLVTAVNSALIEARRAGIAFTPSSSQVADAWKHAAEAIVDELADAQ
jgi:hypothetical protein